MIIVKGFLYIPEILFNRELKEQLIIPNPEYEKRLRMKLPVDGVEKQYVLYSIVKTSQGDFYKIPKYALGSMEHLTKYYRTVKFSHKIFKEEIKFTPPKRVKLTPEQDDTIARAIAMMESERGAIIVAATGEGKTTMAVKIICQLGLKTLVLCHKDSLIEQWREELLNLTNLKKNEIGLLKQGKFTDGKVVIGSQASLMRELRLGREINDLFTFKIQDEVHRIGAKMFLKAFARFNTKYSLGLSATPNRSDSMERLYFLHTSDNKIIHKNTRSVKSVYYPVLYRRSMKWKRYPSFIPFNIQVLNNIVADSDRLQFIANIICEMPNRNFLIVGSRIKYLKELMDIMEERLPKKNIMRFFGEETETTRRKEWKFTFKKGESFIARFHETEYKIICMGFNKDKTEANLVIDGKQKYVKIQDILESEEHFLQFHLKRAFVKITTKVEEFEQPALKELHKADMIFATIQKFQDALNFPHLDTLIAITPYSDENIIIQMKGRIERYLEGKRQPLIIEIMDSGIKHTTNMFNKRVDIYDSLGIERISSKQFEKLKSE